MIYTKCITSIVLLFLTYFAIAQKGMSEFEARRISGTLDATQSATLAKDLRNNDDAHFFPHFRDVLTNHNIIAPVVAAMDGLANDVNAAFADIDNKSNAAVIVVYRDMKVSTANTFSPDFESVKTKIYHRQSYGNTLSNYLLNTKRIFLVFIDIDSAYYESLPSDNNKKLSNTSINIVYKTSFFKQSMNDLGKVLGSMGGPVATTFDKLGFTIVEMDIKRVTGPCDIVLSNKSFKEDLSFTVHDKNFASFQVGVSSNNLAAKNFSISNGNLIVTPDDAQKQNWKSSAYALIELHLPRDIENFQPIWKVLFGPNPYPDHKSGHFVKGWLYNVLLDRVGVYGGLKISKDPLSNIYSGFNYSITKELAVNIGLTWENELIPQVTSIGDITSVSDAAAYAKRKYGSPRFSWGISFSPSSFLSMIGVKK